MLDNNSLWKQRNKSLVGEKHTVAEIATVCAVESGGVAGTQT
jgi:hypothetical protein